MYNQRFKTDYGEMILAIDSKNNWRYDFFPYYKCRRRINKDKSNINWNILYKFLDQMVEELKEFFPYRVLKIDKCEADDIIAALVSFNSQTGSNNIVIISGDKDFAQLQVNKNVRQFSPTLKKFIIEKNPRNFLKEHIIRGDAIDDIPNILSPDDCIKKGQRQVTMSARRFNALMNTGPIVLRSNEELESRWERNETLIDLTNDYENLWTRILNEYNAEAGKTRTNIRQYFIKYKLSNLMSSINEF